MHNNIEFLKHSLTLEEIETIKSIIKTVDSESKFTLLRDFFHDPLIFNKIKDVVDPTWLTYDIFINIHHYEF